MLKIECLICLKYTMTMFGIVVKIVLLIGFMTTNKDVEQSHVANKNENDSRIDYAQNLGDC